MNSPTAADPFKTLGVRPDASEAQIRARYLELVKRYPPESEPDKFREVRAAFEAASDPLLIARRLIEPPHDDVPRWSDVIEQQRSHPPALTPSLILSLGNRASVTDDTETGQADQRNPSSKEHFVEGRHE